MQGVEYDVDFERSKDGPWSQITTVTVKDAQPVDLGDTRISTSYGPQPLAKRVVAAFGNKTPLTERLTTLKHEATRDHTRIAVVVAEPDSDDVTWFYRLLRGTSNNRQGIADEEAVKLLRTGMNDFRQMWVPTAKMDSLNEVLGLPADLPSLVANGNNGRGLVLLLDNDGSYLTHFQRAAADSQSSTLAFLKTIAAHQLPDRDAAEVLQAAQQQAASENKSIFLQETATWCGPCHRLSRFIEQHRTIFDRHFVWVKIDRQRMTGADSVMENIRPGKSRSIPWIAVLDESRKVLSTSTKPDGEDNYGFPTQTKEIERFLRTLQESAPQITDEELKTLRQALSD